MAATSVEEADGLKQSIQRNKNGMDNLIITETH